MSKLSKDEVAQQMAIFITNYYDFLQSSPPQLLTRLERNHLKLLGSTLINDVKEHYGKKQG